MNARFYVGSIGRFASADTIVPDPANPQQFNRYSYVLNSPINKIDPSGHVGICFQGSGKTEVDPDSTVAELCSQLDAEGLLGEEGFVAYANDADDINRAFAFILQMLDEKPDEPVHLIGYSWGGGAALELATLLEEEGIAVDTLVLIDPVVAGRQNRAATEIRKKKVVKPIWGDPFELPYSFGYTVPLPRNIDQAYNFYATATDIAIFEGISHDFNHGALAIGIDANHNSIMNRTCTAGPLTCTGSRISGSASSASSGGATLNQSTYETILSYLERN